MNNSCRICKGPTVKFYHTVMKSHYYSCSYCEFISKDVDTQLTEKEELTLYNTHVNSIDDPHYVSYFRTFIEKTLLDHCTVGMVGLDFGSGPEPVLAKLLERDYGFKMDIYDLFYSPHKSYDKQTYDFITVTEVLEHLRSPMAYFELFRSLLKANGILAIMTNFHHGSETHFNSWHYTRDQSHISFYTPKTFEVIAELVGFEKRYCDTVKNIVLKKI